MLEIFKSEKTGYGYDLNNPIKVMGVEGTNYYFSNMKHKEDIIVRIKRDGSLSSPNPDLNLILDRYSVYVLHLVDPICMRVYTMYVDIYNFVDDKEYPEDFEKK